MSRGIFGSSGRSASIQAGTGRDVPWGARLAAVSSSAILSRTTAINAASNSPAPPLISMSLNHAGQLHQFDQGTSEIGRMDECDPGAPPSGACSLVDESGALLAQVL